MKRFVWEVVDSEKQIDPIDEWVNLKRAESYVKGLLDNLKSEVSSKVTEHEGFVKTASGGAQTYTRTEVKPKDSLRFLLEKQGVLDICTKDELDMKKVNEIVEAGIITPEQLSDNVTIKETQILKFVKND